MSCPRGSGVGIRAGNQSSARSKESSVEGAMLGSVRGFLVKTDDLHILTGSRAEEKTLLHACQRHGGDSKSVYHRAGWMMKQRRCRLGEVLGGPEEGRAKHVPVVLGGVGSDDEKDPQRS